MKHSLNIIFISLAVSLVGCSGPKTFDTSNSAASPFVPTPDIPVLPLEGEFCTLTSNTLFNYPAGPYAFACLQADGSWLENNNFPQGSVTNNQVITGWESPALANLADGKMMLSYVINQESSNQEQVWFFAYSQQEGWSRIGNLGMSAGTDPNEALYSQFGGSFFELNGKPYYFWTHMLGGYVSTPSGALWSHFVVDPGVGKFLRHPEVYVPPAAQVAYLHYGEPRPKVWRFNGSTLTAVGNLGTISATQWSLYSAVTEWNGNPVIAYTLSDYLASANWFQTTDITKVLAYDGNNWITLSDAIQDTPGHDGIKPFLFTLNGVLHILYADYSTTGVPTNPEKVVFRFRVKRWDGSIWWRVGMESDPVFLSQRFEYSFIDNSVLVNVYQPMASGGTKQAVLRWSEAGFSYLGQPIKSWPQLPAMQRPRPGAVVKLAP